MIESYVGSKNKIINDRTKMQWELGKDERRKEMG